MFALAIRTSNQLTNRLELLQCLHWQSEPLTNRLGRVAMFTLAVITSKQSPRTIAMFTLAVRPSNPSHRLGLLQCLHWQSDLNQSARTVAIGSLTQ